MFEKIIVELLNKFVGNYFEDIDTSHLNLSVWKGDVVLTNVYIKRSAMDNFYLPFQVVAGKVGSIIMKFPWKNIYTAPVELILKDLHVVARPSQTVPYNQEEEEKQELLSKMKRVEEIEFAQRAARAAQHNSHHPGTSADAALQSSNFKERLMMHIIRNVQIRIEGIHIRCEDTISNPKVPFSFGVVLSSLNVQTTDAAWTPVYITEQMHAPTFHKLVTLSGLALYLNADGKLLAETNTPREKVLHALETLVKSGKGLNYMIGPISADIKLYITPSPETITQPPFSLPKVLVQAVMKQLTLGISNAQFQNMFHLAETTEFMARARIWRKYRPDVRFYKGNYKAWWTFAYQCCLVEIRRRRQSWTFNNMKMHIQLCKEYADNYTKKFVLHKNRTEVEERLLACERVLDQFSILLVRSQIEVKKERIEKLETELKKKHGWVGNFFGWNAAEVADEISAKIGEAWSPSERLKLTTAMGYVETDAPINCPDSYVLYQLEFQLKLVNMIITEFPKGSHGGGQLFQLKIEDVVHKTQVRPVKKGLTIEWKIGNLHADTLPSPDGLVTQLVKGKNVGVGQHFLEFKYERHPLQFPQANGRISMTAKPLEFIYHTRTVQQLVQCFKIPSEIQLRKLRSNAASRLKEWKATGSENLKRMVQVKTDGELLFDINVAAPYFIIPQNGELDENSSVLIVDLGQLRIRTGAAVKPQTTSTNSDTYTIDLKNIKILVAIPGVDNRPPSNRPSYLFQTTKPAQSIALRGGVQLPATSTAVGKSALGKPAEVEDIYNPAHRSQFLAEVINSTTITLVLSKSTRLSIDIEVSDIFIRLSAGTVELLERISKSWMASTEAAEQVARQAVDRSDMWLPKVNKISEFPFLNTDVILSPSNSVDQFDGRTNHGVKIHHSSQTLSLKPISTIVTFEVGANASTIPLLFFEAKFELEIFDWSEHIRVNGKLSLAAACMNTNLGMWEYLIEPVEAGHYGSAMHRPWELYCEISKTRTSLKDSSQMSFAATSKLILEDHEFHRVFIIKLYSNDILELTVSRTAVEVLSKLHESFKGVTKATVSQRQVSRSPYVFINDTGTDLKLLLQNGPFRSVGAGMLSRPGELSVPSGMSIDLALDISTRYSVLREQEGRVERHLQVSIPEYQLNKSIQVNRAEGKFYPLPKGLKGSTSTFQNGLVCDVRVKDCSVVVTIRGVVNISNHLTIPIDVFCFETKLKKNKLIGRVESNQVWNVPVSVLTSYPDGFFFAPAGYNQSLVPFSWVTPLEKEPTKGYFICTPSPELKLLCHIMVASEVQPILFENSNRQSVSSRSCCIHIRPPLVIINLLPTELRFYQQDKEQYEITAVKGHSIQVTSVDRREDVDFSFMLKLPSYGGLVWTSSIIIKKATEELTCWEFTSTSNTSMHLGIRKEIQEGTVMLHVYSQFWMVNLTELTLSYKQGDDKVGSTLVNHLPTQSEPVMFSVGCKDFLAAKTARLKCGESEWSGLIYLDVAGSSALVKCIFGPTKQEYQINATTSLVDGTFTKAVSFKPRFYFINRCPFPITLVELGVTDMTRMTINAKLCLPFWPRSKLTQLKAAVAKTEEFSAIFPYDRTHNTVLNLKNRYGGFNVHVLVAANRTTITMEEYREGQAPVLLLNATKSLRIEYYELEIPDPSKGILLPNTNMLFTWSYPTGKRTIVWSAWKNPKTEIMDQLFTDGAGTFGIKSDSGETTNYYWISFLERFQRILLFTDSLKLAKNFEESKNKEVTQVELSFSLSGVGFSLVDIVKSREILYMRISSVGVAWETTRDITSNRYRQMDEKISYFLEMSYREYLQEITNNPLHSGIYKFGTEFEVNFADMVVNSPYTRHLRRCPLQPGLWIYFKKFAHSTQVHVKVNRIQVDNQLPNGTFPVLLSQVVPPKSVTTGDEMHKPFVNLSLIRSTTPESQSIQFIYCTVLIQEFNIMADIALANAVNSVFDLSTRNREVVEQMFADFQKQCEMISIGSEKYFSRKLLFRGKELHIENLQLSPIKLHLSFSVTQSKDDGRSIGHLFLKSIGVTIGSAQDVVFKLAGLELKHMTLTSEQLVHEVKTHYTSQATKQLYAYFFGLDVIGNPISYLSGVTEGIEAFFYEPVQGAILGPEEFAEGLSLGLKSLVGHTVGGTADALSKITGVLGKGIALLSLDEDYQRRRRTTMGSKLNLTEYTKTFLKTGIIDTVLGVLTSPMKGAYQGGLPGFGMGLVKGTLGLVARPFGGAFDLASGTFDMLKRATKQSEELSQARPPRYVERNRGIEPYVRQIAEGAIIFRELKSQRELAGERYVAHIPVGKTADRLVLLITESRVFYLKLNDIYGRSTIQWEHQYDALIGPPTIQETEKGIVFTLRGNNRKLSLVGYSKNIMNQTAGEKLFIPVIDVEMCGWMLSKVSDSMAIHASSIQPQP